MADFSLFVIGRFFAAEPYVLSVLGTERANANYEFEVRLALDPADDLDAPVDTATGDDAAGWDGMVGTSLMS